MWLLQIRIIVVKPLLNPKTTILIEPPPHLIPHMHMQIHTAHIPATPHSPLEFLHHLSADPELPVGLQHHERQDVGCLDALVVLDADCVAADHDVVVEDGAGELGVLHDELAVEGC
jgi:hypothetical protein